MCRLSDMTSRPHGSEHGPEMLAVRTYQQIARILSQRDGTATTQALVGQICRAAERKLASALLADPDIRDQFLPRTRSASKPRQTPRRLCHATAGEAWTCPADARL